MATVQEPVGATPESAPRALLAERYEVLETLGGGGFGVVHKAWDRLLHRTVAIKVMRPEILAAGGVRRDEVIKRFEREATTAAGLAHPAIVTVHDIGLTGGVPYLAMEYIDSVGLDRVIAREGRLPAERAALVALEVAEALEYAHAHGVLHRDVKPQNIVVPRSGARPVKLVDFGLAKALDCTDHLTRTGTFLGTPSYASPEQVGGEPMDGRTDVWSIGCVLYEMLTGEKAFTGVSITSVVVKIMTVDPPPVRQLDPDVPEDLARIVGKAMAKEPAARYATARELVADLRHFVRSHASAPGDGPTAAATTPAQRVEGATVVAATPAPPLRVRRRWLAAAGAAAVLALAGVLGALSMRRAPDTAPAVAPPSTIVTLGAAATPEPLPAVTLPAAPAPLPSERPPDVKRSASARAPRVPSPQLPVREPLEPLAAAPPPSAPPAEDVNRVYGPSDVETAPQKVALELPAYPRRAPQLRRGQTLSVTLSYVVGADGSVSDVTVARSSGVRLVDDAVAAAARNARYRPGTRAGQPVATRVSHAFSFRGE